MSSTSWNWSWVKTETETAKASNSIKASGGTVFSFRQPFNGQVSAADLNAGFASAGNNISSLWGNWTAYTRPLIDSLPAGGRDQRWSTASGKGLPNKIDALKNGLQGTTLFVFNDASVDKAEGRYWHADDGRPKTIAESFEDVHTRISTTLLTGGSSDSVTDADVAALWYAIGNNYESISLTSVPTSLDARTGILESYKTQTNEDIYGVTAGYGYGFGTPLLYSLAENLDEILKLHNVASGWQEDPSGVSHASAGAVTLDDAYDGDGVGAGRTITADTGAVVINGSGTSTSALELVTNTGLINGLTIKDGTTTYFAASRNLVTIGKNGTGFLYTFKVDVAGPGGSLDIGAAAVAQNINIGNSTGAGSVNIVAGSNNINLNSTTVISDDTSFNFGTDKDAAFEWDTGQAGVDSLKLGLGSSRHLIICEKADISTDFGHGADTNPTLYIHSADATEVTQYLSTTHDQTNVLTMNGLGTSNENIDSFGGFIQTAYNPEPNGTVDKSEQLMIPLSLRDTETHVVSTAGHGMGMVSFMGMEANERAYAFFTFSTDDGGTTAVTLINSSNVTNGTGGANSLNVFGGANQITIENNMGETGTNNGQGVLWLLHQDTPEVGVA